MRIMGVRKWKVFALSNYNTGVAIYRDGKDWEEQHCRERLGVWF